MADSEKLAQVTLTSAIALPLLRALGFVFQFATTLILFETLSPSEFVGFTYLISLIAILSTATMLGLPFYLLSSSGSQRRLIAMLPQSATLMVSSGVLCSGLLVFLLTRALESSTLLFSAVSGVFSVFCLALAKLGSVFNQLDNRMIRAHAPEVLIRPGVLLACAIFVAVGPEYYTVYSLPLLIFALALATIPGVIWNSQGIMALRKFKDQKKVIELSSLVPFSIISFSGTLFVNSEYTFFVNFISDSRLLSEIRIVFQISIAMQLAKQLTEMLFAKDIARSAGNNMILRSVLSKAIIYSGFLTAIFALFIPVGIYIVDDVLGLATLTFVWPVLPEILLGQAGYILLTPCAIFLQMTNRAGLLATIQLSTVTAYSLVLLLTTPSSLELAAAYHSIFYACNALLVLIAFIFSRRGTHAKK